MITEKTISINKRRILKKTIALSVVVLFMLNNVEIGLSYNVKSTLRLKTTAHSAIINVNVSMTNTNRTPFLK